MFTITVDTTGPDASLEDMHAKIRTLYPMEMNQVFLTWQEDDMNRQYPTVELQAPDSMYTMVYPRSRRSGPRPRGRTAARKPGGTGQPIARHGAERPILRPELLEQLSIRMGQLLGGIDWR